MLRSNKLGHLELLEVVSASTDHGDGRYWAIEDDAADRIPTTVGWPSDDTNGTGDSWHPTSASFVELDEERILLEDKLKSDGSGDREVPHSPFSLALCSLNYCRTSCLI